MIDVWDLIENDRFTEACAMADRDFEITKSLLPLRNKVFALLNLHRYDEAEEICNRLILLSMGDTDSDFIFLGLTQWLKKQYAQAIVTWKSATKTQYTDAAGGVEVYLILFFASVFCSDEALKNETIMKLKSLCKSKRSMNWPGPIAKYITGLLGEQELLSIVAEKDVIRQKQLCQSYFFIGIIRMINKDNEYKKYLLLSHSQGAVTYVKPEYYLSISMIE